MTRVGIIVLHESFMFQSTTLPQESCDPVAQSRFYIRVNCVLRYGWEPNRRNSSSILLPNWDARMIVHTATTSASVVVVVVVDVGWWMILSCQLPYPSYDATHSNLCHLHGTIQEHRSWCYFFPSALADGIDMDEMNRSLDDVTLPSYRVISRRKPCEHLNIKIIHNQNFHHDW